MEQSKVFRTVYDRKRVQVKNIGSRVKDLRRGEYDERGILRLVPAGQDDWYGMIQAGKDSCDINRIVELYTRTGDVSVFRQREGQYIDVTKFPKTYAEILNTISNAQSQFEELPLSEREKYNHDFSQWFAALDDQLQKLTKEAAEVAASVQKEDPKKEENLSE